MVLINCATGIGTTLAYILSLYMKWRAVIVLYAILVSLSPLIILLVRTFEKKNDPSNISDCIKSSIWSKKEIDGTKIIATFERVFKTRTNIIIMTQGIFGCIPWGTLSLFLLYAIAEKLNTSFTIAGLILTLSGAFYPVSLVLAPKIDNLRENKRYGLLIKLVIFAVLAQTMIYVLTIQIVDFSTRNIVSKDILEVLEFLKDINIIAIVILFGLFMCVSSLVGPITRNVIVDVNHSNNRATSLTVVRLFENIGSAIGLIIGGILVDIHGSFYAAVKYICIFWLICALIWTPLIKIYPREIVDSETK